jgi:hypothetical protein
MDRRGPKYEPGVGGGGWGVDTSLAAPVILTDMSWDHCKIHFPIVGMSVRRWMTAFRQNTGVVIPTQMRRGSVFLCGGCPVQ